MKCYIARNVGKLSNIFSSKYFDINAKELINFIVFFRVGIAGIALIDFISLIPDLNFFFSADRTYPQRLSFLYSEYFYSLDSLYTYVDNMNDPTIFYNGCIILYIMSLSFLLLGFLSRFSAIVALLLQLLIFKSFAGFNYGYDQFMTTSLFYLCIFPVSTKYSIDSIFMKKVDEPIKRFNYRRVMQLHLFIVYTIAGVAKMLDIGWWNGNSLWRAVASINNSFHDIPISIYLIFGLGSMLSEAFYAPLMTYKRTRFITLGLIISMHLGIAIALGLYSFAAIMIVWNVAAWYKFE